MATVNEIFSYMCELAPLGLQMDFDNSGFLLGHGDAPVTRALLSLDITAQTVDEAISHGAELIISHHPLIFSPLKSITDAEPDTAKILRLAENHVAVISMHTNLDISCGGVNDVLISTLGLTGAETLDEDGCGRIGELAGEISLAELLRRCKAALNTNGLRYYDSGRGVHRVAVMGGSGGDAIRLAFAKACDTYLTADIKYHQFLEAEELGINLIDAGHFDTENPVIPVLAQKLAHRFSDVRFIVSKSHDRVISFF